jgi:dephospho-CoA kinase
MLVGISGDINSGKDVVGRMFSIFDIRVSKQIFFSKIG